MIVKVIMEDREDGGVRVYSPEVPGFSLSGRDRTKVIAAIEPALRAIFRHKGNEPKSLRIDCTVSRPHHSGDAK